MNESYLQACWCNITVEMTCQTCVLVNRLPSVLAITIVI